MKTTVTYRWLASMVGLMLCAGVARGYLVGPAVSLEKLTVEADIIFKGTAVSSGPVQDGWFTPCQDFVARQTQFKVISIIKGERPGDRLLFRHYDEDPQPQFRLFQPQYYRFEIGRTYIVFAAQSGSPGVFRQIWMNHTTKEDQGVLRCANDKPVDRKAIKEVLWAELMAMLATADARDVVYAVGQLDQMSGAPMRFDRTSDFDRMDVLAAVHGLMTSGDPKIAQAAIGLVGAHDQDIGEVDPKTRNVGGSLYRKDLVALADSRAPVETRAAAIRALRLVREPSLKEAAERWVADPASAVRASGVLVLADFPGPETCKRLTVLADDPAPEVRACVALAASIAQQAEMADVLARLLVEGESKVREAAAKSLLSFSPKKEAIAAVLRANLENEEFKPLFLLALAREDPARYLDALATVVEQKTEPRDFWGGQVPAFTAWEILFRYLQAQPVDALRAGKFDRYLDAMEKVGNYSSSEPRDIYAFYLQRGMTERASKFRQAAKKSLSYDIEYYFKQVDKDPSQYQRQ